MNSVPDISHDETVLALEAFVQPFSLSASQKMLAERAHEYSMPVMIPRETIKGWACELPDSERTALGIIARNFDISQHDDMITKEREFHLLVEFITSASAEPSGLEKRTCEEIWARGRTSIGPSKELMAMTDKVKIIMFYKIKRNNLLIFR